MPHQLKQLLLLAFQSIQMMQPIQPPSGMKTQ
jgi:hypothetical protein